LSKQWQKIKWQTTSSTQRILRLSHALTRGDNKVEKLLAGNIALGKSNAEDNSNDTAKINNKSNEKQKRDTTETKLVNSNESEKVINETDVSVTVIDDNIIYSAKLPELLKKKVVEVAPPTPPYEPSEYKLKKLANIKRINDYMEKNSPKNRS
jgi:hypothetical protein